MGFAFPKELREALIESEPEKFSLPRQSDMRYHWVHVRLDAIDADEMHELVEDAWAFTVPKSVIEEYLRSDRAGGPRSPSAPGPHLVLEGGLLEVREPAVGRDHREVGAEEHFRLQLGVRVLDELRWEVRRPAGDRSRRSPCAGKSRSPRPARERRVREHDLELGKSAATSSRHIGFEYLRSKPPPPLRPVPMPLWPVWKSAAARPRRSPRTAGTRCGRSGRTPGRWGGT